MKNLFRWNITKDTYLTIGLGLLMIILSVAMLPFSSDGVTDTIISVILRDVCMIFGLGICVVSLYCRKHGKQAWQELGLNRKKTKLSLALNVILSIALVFIFLKEKTPENMLTIGNLYAAIYILTAGIFEMLFIYGFLRMGFEKSFGIIPAIVLTALFYSFHHAGFQPEFIDLFFVGIMYVSVYYITQNLLIIFPFFWATGALWDVLVDSSAGESLKNPVSFFVALGILFAIIIWRRILKQRGNKE